jgi:alpha-mannosidase
LYTAVERKLTYDYYICALAGRSENDIDPHTKNILRLGLCQLIDMHSIPDFAAVNETVKLAEDGSGDLILRLYESMNGTRITKLQTIFDISKVYECNMLEKPAKELAVENGSVTLEFRPFEIKTLRLKR